MMLVDFKYKDKQGGRPLYAWLFLILFLPVWLTGCDSWKNSGLPEEADGYRPVYQTEQESREVSFVEHRPMSVPGKILLYDKWLLVTDKGKGIHLYDNSNPGNPQPLGYLVVPGCTELHFRNPILYANNYTDLIAIDVTDPTQPRITSRIGNAFPVSQDQTAYPPRIDDKKTYFECVDPNRGVVVGWERANIKNPKCYR